jgi:hypothetical protein
LRRPFSDSRCFNRLTSLASASASIGKRLLADPKIPHTVFGFTATLVLLYGLVNVGLIVSTCINLQKNLKLTSSLLQSFALNTGSIKVCLKDCAQKLMLLLGSIANQY